jgi:hypothetical protein
MAFPGTLNFSYYKGDTYEFKVYPKNVNGSTFDLSTYTSVGFTISTARGSAGLANQIECSAEISDTDDYVLCTIKPADSVDLVAGVSYVYDVEISKTVSAAPVVYTLLTGSIEVTDQVTGATA